MVMVLLDAGDLKALLMKILISTGCVSHNNIGFHWLSH